tara:strand:+ start:567 stop:1295 length:729 start_codon:yes stop_codon:yes gene_type:complete
MLKNIIEFSASEDYLNLKENYPQPIKLHIPSWFKKLEHSPDNLTIKGCIPFLETMTTGYVLTLPQDFHLQHNVFKDGKLISRFVPSVRDRNMFNLNFQENPELHPTDQVGDSPFVKKNLNFPINKILNPWTIKTPPGYSCLFTAPLNNTDDRFSIIAGIVNTDTFEIKINFPFIVNGDKYPVLDTILKQGTPYVQVIPFKRNDWKMKIKKEQNKISFMNSFLHTLKVLHRYKLKWWSKSNFS